MSELLNCWIRSITSLTNSYLTYLRCFPISHNDINVMSRWHTWDKFCSWDILETSSIPNRYYFIECWRNLKSFLPYNYVKLWNGGRGGGAGGAREEFLDRRQQSTSPQSTYIFISGCPPVVSGASAGVIYSPNFPWYYPNNKSCYWQIRVPYYQKININFTYIYPNEDCDSYVEILDIYSDRVIKTFWFCETPTPSSMTYSGSIRVRFYPAYRKTSSFLAFYQIRYNSPFPYHTYAPTWPEPTQSTNPVSACKPVNSKFS